MPELTHGIAAWSELLIAIMSFYGSAAAVLNKHFGRVFLPVGKPFGIFKNVKNLFIELRKSLYKLFLLLYKFKMMMYTKYIITQRSKL